MGRVEELHSKQQIFDELFQKIDFVVETKDKYRYPNRRHICFHVTVESRMNLVREEVTAMVTCITGRIEEKIERVFKPSIPPQTIYLKPDFEILDLDAGELLDEDDWNTSYADLLAEAIFEDLKYVELLDEEGNYTDYRLRIKDVYY
ncbi:hypothetical protein EJF36_19070 [Bacillus sp. HMF5848]|uniref:hypothetical protein n=1 Tax=Bacillus sp. HMF5848 TaxID=2495421 RepID=UPI000F7795C1|nr:hypothetical protein [Bacillus sp. HMF5848]RSK28807.1 hypothetical protein EJF36_19070 [Bacillus sp. HMF5848]